MFAISQNIMIQTKKQRKNNDFTIFYHIISPPGSQGKKMGYREKYQNKKCDHSKHNRCLQYLQSAETYGKIRHIHHQQFMQGVAP